jgi:hypothetical protein
MGDGASTGLRQVSEAADQILWQLEGKLGALAGRGWQGGAWQGLSLIIPPLDAWGFARASLDPLSQGLEIRPQARHGRDIRANRGQIGHGLGEGNGVGGELIGRDVETPGEQQTEQRHKECRQPKAKVGGSKFHHGMPRHGRACHGKAGRLDLLKSKL